MKIWIDLDNSPHVLFFSPIIERLKLDRIETLITVRSFSQTEELATQHGLHYSLVGSHRNPRQFVTRATATFHRAGQLAWFIRKHNPDIAISHGSRALVLAAWALGIPSMTLYDYEFVSAGVFHRLSKRILVPELIASKLLDQGLDPGKLVTYPGFKEEAYVYDFQADPAVLRELSLDPNRLIITVRPPADWAHYHNRTSEVLFSALIERLRKQRDAQVIIVPRTATQAAELIAKYQLAEGPFRVLERAIDGLSLMWFSDAVFSGGGTMVREAALLGINVYSTFAGKPGAADQQLALEGKLKLVRDPAELDQIVFSKQDVLARHKAGERSRTLESIGQQIINFAVSRSVDARDPVAA